MCEGSPCSVAALIRERRRTELLAPALNVYNAHPAAGPRGEASVVLVAIRSSYKMRATSWHASIAVTVTTPTLNTRLPTSPQLASRVS